MSIYEPRDGTYDVCACCGCAKEKHSTATLQCPGGWRGQDPKTNDPHPVPGDKGDWFSWATVAAEKTQPWARGSVALGTMTDSDDDDVVESWFGPDDSSPIRLSVGIHSGVTDRAYHSDCCETPSLSASMAGILTRDSAKHAHLYHPRLGGARRKETDATENGSVSHALILGVGKELEVIRIAKKEKGKPTGEIIDAQNWQTNEAKEKRAAARAAGRIPVLAKKEAIIRGTVSAVRESMAELDPAVILDGESEVTLIWTETAMLDGEQVPVLCRGRLDHLRRASGVWYDLKFCESVAPRSIQRHMVEYGTDIQHAAYTSALTHLCPEMAGRWDGQIVFCETTPPYCVVPVRPDGTMRELGAHKWERAKTMWARCLRDNRFPGYVTGVIDISAPAWAMSEEMSC